MSSPNYYPDRLVTCSTAGEGAGAAASHQSAITGVFPARTCHMCHSSSMCSKADLSPLVNRKWKLLHLLYDSRYQQPIELNCRYN